MLPPELLNGQRFDINRPFGNGRDDDGDGVVDEPDEYGLGEPAWITPEPDPANPMIRAPVPSRTATCAPTRVNLAVDWNGDGTIDINDALMARHIMARHLYVLAMMSIDPTVLQHHESADLDPIRRRRGYRCWPRRCQSEHYQVEYALAQWAINCVDFRDRDSMMTPFEFDIKPFDGWGVDGVVGNGTTIISADDTSLPSVTCAKVPRRAGACLGLRAAGNADHRNARLARPANPRPFGRRRHGRKRGYGGGRRQSRELRTLTSRCFRCRLASSSYTIPG